MTQPVRGIAKPVVKAVIQPVRVLVTVDAAVAAAATLDVVDVMAVAVAVELVALIALAAPVLVRALVMAAMAALVAVLPVPVVRDRVPVPAKAAAEPVPQTALQVAPAVVPQAVSQAVPAYVKPTAPAYARTTAADNALQAVRSDAPHPAHQAASIHLWLRDRRCHHDDERADKRIKGIHRCFV